MATKLIPDIIYKSVDGEDILLDLLVPDPLPESPAPLVVEIHGGGWLSGAKDGNRGLAFAERGFITASLDYRLCPKHTHPAQIDDCRDAIRWLRANAATYAIDPTRVGVHGGSAGGHLVALLGTSGREIDRRSGGISCDVQAVVDLCGPTSLVVGEAIPYEGGDIYEMFLGGPIAENLEAAREASPVSFVAPGMPPFVIMHCADDPVVPVRQSETLRDALLAAGADVTTVIYPTGGHGFDGHWEEIGDHMMSFFVKHLT